MMIICIFQCRQFQRSRQNYDDSSAAYKRVSAVVTQALLYIAAFIITYIWMIIMKSIRFFGGNSSFPWVLRAINRFFYPLQGFFNWLIFLRPTFQRIRMQNPTYWWFHAFWDAMKKESVGFYPHSGRRKSAALSAALRRSSSSCHRIESSLARLDMIGSDSSSRSFHLPASSDLESDDLSDCKKDSGIISSNSIDNKSKSSSTEFGLEATSDVESDEESVSTNDSDIMASQSTISA
jgi:hypothetical protein